MVYESNKLYSIYKIDDKNCYKSNINKYISYNFDDKNNSYLLLEIKPSLSSLISPFILNNSNKEYNKKILKI